MRSHWLWLTLLSLIFVMPTLAQDSTPPAALEAASNAIRNELGISENPSNWSYQLLPETGNTNLGCLSVSGTETGLTFTPYRISVTFTTGTYIVHTLADGSRTVICDPQISSSSPTPDPSDPLANECTANPVATFPLYTQPSTDMPILANLQGGTDYLIVGQSNPAGWFQVTFNNTVGWVEATSVIASPNCDSVVIPVSGYTAPTYTGPDCFVTPAGAFANVRNNPSTDNTEVVFQAFENTVFQATAIPPNDQWYFIQYGYIAFEVVLTEGDCTGIDRINQSPPILPLPTANTGTTTPTTAVIDTNVQSALTQFACPAGYAGYMPPRIGLGNSNAAIDQGGIPNTLRAFPTVDDNVGTRIGTIQPSRTLDRVISGPVCNQGFVWWYIEIDGTLGWTAESNAADSSYFITPVGAQNIPTATGGQAPIVDNSLPTISTGAIPTIGQSPVGFGTLPILGISYGLAGDVVFIAALNAGFGTSTATVIGAVSTLQNDGARVAELTEEALGFSYVPTIARLIVPTTTGAVLSFSAPPDAIDTVLNLPIFDTTPSFDIHSLGRIAWGNCTDATCSIPTIAMYDIPSAQEVWLKQASASVDVISISPSGRLVASGSSDGAVQFWDANNGAVVSAYQETNQATLAGETAYSSLAFNPSDENQLLIAGCNARDFSGTCTQGRVGLVNSSDGSLIGIVPQFNNEVTHIAYYVNGSRFVSTDGQNVIVANAATGTTLVEWNFSFNEDVEITAMEITTGDTRLVIGTSDGNIILVDLTNVR